jgi:hypothetical protein
MKKVQVYIGTDGEKCAGCHGLQLTWQGNWRCSIFDKVMFEQKIAPTELKRLEICIKNEQE